jgi:hypothetical protein
VSFNPRDQVSLDAGERYLQGWAAEMTGPGAAKGERGWLILTDARCLFFRRAGRFRGGALEKSPRFALQLGEIHSAVTRQFSLPIGYGDHFAVPGLELNGQEFRVDRETPAGPIVTAILEAVRNRTAVGAPR